jgi:uncharacterized protein YlxP (DUF503 family)
MLIAAALLELELAEADSIKAKRRVVNAIKDRVRARFNVSIAEVAGHDERHSILIGCVKVGVEARKLREQMEKIVRTVESLGLAEVVSDDVIVVRLDEVEEVDDDELDCDAADCDHDHDHDHAEGEGEDS